MERGCPEVGLRRKKKVGEAAVKVTNYPHPTRGVPRAPVELTSLQLSL